MDFDTTYNRENTRAYKIERKKVLFKTDDVIPLWVADMDFVIAEPIYKALKERIKHPIFGYTFQNEDFFKAIVNWQQKRHNWKISERSISVINGVLPALAISIQALTTEGDEIMIQPPVYPPFFQIIKSSNRQIVENPLINNNGKYSIDFDDMENSFKKGVKLIILSNPHNPVGKIWSINEINRLVELCVKYNVIILSDEIHSDLIISDKKHIPIASTSKEASDITITYMSPSKTFNIAGLAIAYTIIENRHLKKRYKDKLDSMHLSMGNVFGTEALIAAYNEGEEWLNSLTTYIKANVIFVTEFIKIHIPEIEVAKSEATYLLWLDFNKLFDKHSDLKEFLIKEAKLGLNSGTDFGTQGNCFARINLASSRDIIEKAMFQLKDAFDRKQ
ncbi:MAG: PatB family C-S lyase [Flavobacteriales bacterium]|nr:PatB family C-S lyase [Flavobacteriales bacterium]